MPRAQHDRLVNRAVRNAFGVACQLYRAAAPSVAVEFKAVFDAAKAFAQLGRDDDPTAVVTAPSFEIDTRALSPLPVVGDTIAIVEGDYAGQRYMIAEPAQHDGSGAAHCPARRV